jgi:hypothetical protein
MTISHWHEFVGVIAQVELAFVAVNNRVYRFPCEKMLNLLVRTITTDVNMCSLPEIWYFMNIYESIADVSVEIKHLFLMVFLYCLETSFSLSNPMAIVKIYVT